MLSAFGNGQISPKRYIHAAYKWGCRSMRTPSALIGLIMLVGSGFASAAQPLSTEESLFVTVTLASLVVPIKCEGYHIIDGGLPRLADAAGVDGRRLIRAVVAAF